MNHEIGIDRNWIFQNSLIERTQKAAFRALDLSINYSRPFPSDLKTDQEVLLDANLKVKPAKCMLCQEKVTYLGHVVSCEGVTTDPEKTAKVSKWPTPTSERYRWFLEF